MPKNSIAEIINDAGLVLVTPTQFLSSVILYQAIEFVTILLPASHEEWIVWRIVKCSLLLQAFDKVMQTFPHFLN